MLSQRWFAVIATYIFLALAFFLWNGIRENWILEIGTVYVILIGISISTWHITAPEYAEKLFKVKPYKSKYGIWISAIIEFSILIFGYFSIMYFMKIPISENYWFVGVALFVALWMSFQNRKYYK
jgi:hypothetical protein